MSTLPKKGRKTTITWMIFAVIVAGLVVWRIARGPDEPASQQPAVASNADPTPSAAPDKPADPPPVAAPSGHPKVDPSKPAKVLELRDQHGKRVADKPKPPGEFTEVPAQTGRASVNILALHGRGDTGRNFSQLARAFDPQLAWRFLEGPLDWNRGEGHQWFDSDALRAGRGSVDETLALVRAHIDSMDEPVVLFGFSQGCMTILHLLARGAHKVTAAVCVGGSIVGPMDFVEGPRSPVLFVYGSGDTVVTPEATRKAIQAFENRGFAVEQIEHSGRHSIPNTEIGRIGSWLIDKVRGK